MADLGSAFMAPVLQNQEFLQKEQSAPVDLAHKAASARYTRAMADHLEMETAADKNVAQAMAQQASAGAAQGQQQSVSQRLLGMSTLYGNAGMPTKAAQYAQWAAQAAAHESTAQAADVRKQFEEFKMNSGMIDKAVKLFGSVKDEASWEAMNETLEKETGKRSPFADTPYDPQMVEMLKGQALTEFQRQGLDLRRKALAARVADIQSAMAHRNNQDQISGQRLRLSEQRETRLTKSGGKDVGAPGKTETEAAARLLGDSLEGDEKDTAAFALASDARVLRSKNKGLSADDALRQAMLNAQKAGDFIPFVKGGLFGRNTPGKFMKPIPVPAAQKDMVAGQHYVFPNGAVGEWTGDKKNPWKKVGKSSGAAAPAGARDDSEEDDDDE